MSKDWQIIASCFYLSLLFGIRVNKTSFINYSNDCLTVDRRKFIYVSVSTFNVSVVCGNQRDCPATFSLQRLPTAHQAAWGRHPGRSNSDAAQTSDQDPGASTQHRVWKSNRAPGHHVPWLYKVTPDHWYILHCLRFIIKLSSSKIQQCNVCPCV